jgi:hypothetical protein
MVIALISAVTGHASAGNADYVNGYNDGYSNEQSEATGINFCTSAETFNYTSGTPYNYNPDDDNSSNYDSGWAAGCEDAANGKASNP